jgi:hypothetical protein
MSKPGLSIETAASVTLQDALQKHMHTFSHVIKHDRAANNSVLSVYVNGLAGAIALTVVGGHASKDDVIDEAVRKLRECVDRDLQHLGR